MLVKHEQTNDSNIELPQLCPQPLPVFPKREVPPTVGLIDAVLKPHRRLGGRAAADHRITPELTAFVSDGRRAAALVDTVSHPFGCEATPRRIRAGPPRVAGHRPAPDYPCPRL